MYIKLSKKITDIVKLIGAVSMGTAPVSFNESFRKTKTVCYSKLLKKSQARQDVWLIVIWMTDLSRNCKKNCLIQFIVPPYIIQYITQKIPRTNYLIHQSWPTTSNAHLFIYIE